MIKKIIDNKRFIEKKINADIQVELTFSDDLVLVSDDLYTYNGGFMILKINDEICHEFKNLKLESDLKLGNPKRFVIEYVQNQINNHLKINQKEILKTIKSCLDSF